MLIGWNLGVLPYSKCNGIKLNDFGILGSKNLSYSYLEGVETKIYLYAFNKQMSVDAKSSRFLVS
jgi:hypothetical protein